MDLYKWQVHQGPSRSINTLAGPPRRRPGLLRRCRAATTRRPSTATRRVIPGRILFNEDDHFDFDKPANNFAAAVAAYASRGYFDYRRKGEGFDEGYQSVPVNWKTSSARKRGFFKLLSEMTGVKP